MEQTSLLVILIDTLAFYLFPGGHSKQLTKDREWFEKRRHGALSFLLEFAQSRPEFDHQFLKKAPDVERRFEDDSSRVSKGSPSADQPSRPYIKMATAAPPS